jgi:hypothetical protein
VSARLEFPPLPPFRPAASAQPAQSRRSKHPIDQLSRRLDSVCVNAVSPLEIAAALEMDGITDSAARETYGVTDVFALAEELYQRVPFRNKPAPPPATSVVAKLAPAHASFLYSDLARGLLYLCIGMLTPAFGCFGQEPTTIGLIISSVGAWAWSQSMARIGYVLIGRAQEREARAALRLYGLIGVAIITALAWVLVGAMNVSYELVFVVFFETCYSLAAVIYFTLGKDQALWRFAGPGFALGGIFLAVRNFGLAPSWWGTAAFVCEALMVILVVMGAFRVASLGKNGVGFLKPVNLQVSFFDVVQTLPFSLYGLLCALLLATDSAVARIIPEFATHTSGLSLIPLVLSMGVAEWQLRLYREAQWEMLKRTTSLSDYGPRSWRVFLESLARYCLALTVLSVLFAFGAIAVSETSRTFFLGLVTNFILGVGFFCGFVLMAHERVRSAVVGVGLSFAVFIAWLNTPFSSTAPLVAAITLASSLLLLTRDAGSRVKRL